MREWWAVREGGGWWAVREEGGGWSGAVREGDGVMGVWAHRRALLSCPRCCVVVPYCGRVVVARCRRASLSHVAVAYNKQRRTTTLVVVRHLVGPFAAVVFAVVHRRLVVVMLWCRGRVSAVM